MRRPNRLAVLAFPLCLTLGFLATAGTGETTLQPGENEPMFRPGAPWLDTDGQKIDCHGVASCVRNTFSGLASCGRHVGNYQPPVFLESHYVCLYAVHT